MQRREYEKERKYYWGNCFNRFFVFEFGLIKLGPMIWGAENAYHMWGKVNAGLMVIGVIGVVISNVVRRK